MSHARTHRNLHHLKLDDWLTADDDEILTVLNLEYPFENLDFIEYVKVHRPGLWKSFQFSKHVERDVL